MAIFRKVHTSFWSDTFISDLDKDKKLFYLYILTNERTTQCGIYEISKKQISLTRSNTNFPNLGITQKILKHFKFQTFFSAIVLLSNKEVFVLKK